MKHNKRVLIVTLLLTVFLANIIPTASAYSAGNKWQSGSVSYKIDSAIPLGWSLPIYYAKAAWNNAGSSFRFSNDQSSSKKLYYGYLDSRYLAMTYIGSTNGYLTSMETLYSDSKSWSPNGASGYQDVQSCVTHEFGHWLNLHDLVDDSDADKTMYRWQAAGETKRRSLDSDDIAGIRYLYP